MAGWSHHTGRAVAVLLDNIDTDQLIPARFMSRPRDSGYGEYLLHDLRRGGDGELRADFPLNAHDDLSILVAGRNFGSGSSREAAVYALVDAGFRAVVAPGFGDIFASNAVNNGLLPARVEEEDHALLLRLLADGPVQVHIDLATAQITAGNTVASFDLDESWRLKLTRGWDDIDLTRQYGDHIAGFRAEYARNAPWAWPGGAR